MSTESTDGGSAFPVVAEQWNFGHERVVPASVSPGMSLRDYFAAHANEDDIATHMPLYSELRPGDERAKARYRHADAMLEARSA